MKDTDLRITRTQSSLKRALVEIIHSDGYDGASIRAITAAAQVGYQTFFRHYKSKEELLMAIGMDLLEQARTELLPQQDKGLRSTLISNYEFVGKYADSFAAILKSPAAEAMHGTFLNFGLIEGNRLLPHLPASGVPDKLLSYFMISGLMAITRWWVENDQPHPPAEMADMTISLMFSAKTK